MFLIFSTVTMSLPTFLGAAAMNWISAVPFSIFTNLAGAAGAAAVVPVVALVAGACAGLDCAKPTAVESARINVTEDANAKRFMTTSWGCGESGRGHYRLLHLA